MIFNSITFLLFLAICTSLYWVLSTKARLWMLFTASLVFYGFWRVEFLSIILLSTLTDYFVALQIGKTPPDQRKKRKALLFVSIVVNLGLLVFFKYSYFLVDNAIGLANLLGGEFNSPVFDIILPLGISFYTFQTISYTVDVYRGYINPEKNFALYGTYVLFFPQLVAGPVLRASEVVTQLAERPKFDSDLFVLGLKRILMGFFLKVVLADNIAVLVDDGYGMPSEVLSAIDSWTLAFLFGFQIYFDFAGYSHIAIGCAMLMGISFPENFNFPYAARSFRSFWKRWHISLSSWIRDYVYLPIAGVKVIDKNSQSTGGIQKLQSNIISQSKMNSSLFLTWAIMGLWHGSNWTFVLWGLYHATIIFIERQLKGFRERFKFWSFPLVGFIITLPLAMLGWIPFRADSLQDTFNMWATVLQPQKYLSYSMQENTYIVTFLLTVFVTLAYVLDQKALVFKGSKKWVYWSFETAKLAVMIFLIYIFFRPISQFIYFQF